MKFDIEQIEKALKLCSTTGTCCNDCPYFGKTKNRVSCSQLLMRDTLAFISKLIVDNERLSNAIEEACELDARRASHKK